jgi:hypothetical protein
VSGVRFLVYGDGEALRREKKKSGVRMGGGEPWPTDTKEQSAGSSQLSATPRERIMTA